jgi:uncharacterized protein YpbB
MSKKVVEISLNEFKKMVDEMRKCKKEKELLQETNKKLNKEIEEYNDKFTKETGDENEL